MGEQNIKQKPILMQKEENLLKKINNFKFYFNYWNSFIAKVTSLINRNNFELSAQNLSKMMENEIKQSILIRYLIGCPRNFFLKIQQWQSIQNEKSKNI